jgi:hypothetical protein
MINMSPREQAPRTQLPLSAQPSGSVTTDGQPDIPAIRAEYAATREEVLDPEVQALLRNRAANEVWCSLPTEQAHVWMREGLDAVWALVLLEMLDQSSPSLNGRVMLRIPGTTNRKAHPRKKVTFVSPTDTSPVIRYSREDTAHAAGPE